MKVKAIELKHMVEYLAGRSKREGGTKQVTIGDIRITVEYIGDSIKGVTEVEVDCG